MGVLRGFRLLQAAGLSAEEKRDILASTKGSLEFEVVTRALQTLWDEQFLGRQTTSLRSSMGNYFNETFMANEENYEHGWWDDETYDGYWADESWDSSWDSWHEAQHGQADSPHQEEDPPEDPALQDSLQAEREAEALAIQAQRTWTEAQRATAQLRKDRGFGHVRPQNDGKCFLCGGNHFARDCPDKYHPSFNKGKGKGKYPNAYVADWEMADAYYMKGKGKTKSKNKGKMSHMADLNAMWKGKGKSKQGHQRPAVNAYMGESQSLYGMEIKENFEAQSSAASNMKPNLGLLDCGATASAGPETSVQKLISAVLSQDRGAAVNIAKYMRPYFRFGNGCWGQANFRVSITSKASGMERTFHMYCLPDPKNGDSNNVVPVLLGMDHLSGKDSPESALTIDFNTGLAIESLSTTPNIYQLPCNNKGHYIRDIVYYLTLGHSNQQGHPTIHVMEGNIQSAELQTLEFHPVEFYDMAVQDRVHDQHVLECSKRNLLALHARAHGHVGATAEATLASMCPTEDLKNPNSKASASCDLSANGPGTTSRTSSGCNQSCDSKACAVETFGCRAHHDLRQQRSEGGANSVAMLRDPLSNEAPGQRPRIMDPLRSVQSEVAVHSQERQFERNYKDREPRDGVAHVATTTSADGRVQTQCCDLPGDAKEDRRRGDPDDGNQQRGGDSNGLSGLPESKGKPDACISIDSVTKFPLECGGRGHQSGRAAQAPDVRGEGTDGSNPSRTSSCFQCGGHQRERDGLKNVKPTKNVSFAKNAQVTQYANVDQNAQVPKNANVTVYDFASKNDCVTKNVNSVETDFKDKLYKPSSMTHKMAAKVMLFATTMVAMATSTLTSFSLDDRDGLWEIACAPHSWLSDAAQRQGLHPRRINLEAGYDLYKKDTWEHLRALRRRHRPRRLWWSLPCTYWCSWTALNYAGPERQQILEDHRRRERRLLWQAHDFIAEALQEDPDLLIYFEWPYPCYGWSQKPLLAIQALLRRHGQEWLDCRIDGCRYGMVDENQDFLRKKWLVKTNDEHFHSEYRCKVCHGGHSHGRIEGRETQKSAYYPWKMVQSFARFWAKQTVSTQQLRRMNFHEVNEVEDFDLYAAPEDDEVYKEIEAQPLPQAVAEPPNEAERERWKAKLMHFHKSSGHCSTRNLTRIVKDANLESWKVKMAQEFTCPICESLRPGGASSGNVPPAATHAQVGPWEALGLDASEWVVPGLNKKVKFLLMIDYATRLRMAVPLMEPYGITALKTESATQVIEAFSRSWLATFPKPHLVIPDNGMGFVAKEFADFCRDQNIELSMPAEKEPWAHGLVESAMKDFKNTATAIHMDNFAQDPSVTLALTASALNSTEFVSGYSPHQWAFGRAYTISEEDRRLFAQLGDRATFASMVAARQRAEDVATRTRAQRILTRLGNSKARQPLATVPNRRPGEDLAQSSS